MLETMIEINRKELCNLLNVTNAGLKAIINRKQLEDKLLANGYTLVEERKEGREKIYVLKQIETSQKWESIQKKHRIPNEKLEMHDEYSKTRLENMDVPRTKVIDNCNTNVAYSTASRYDNILVEEQIMAKDETVYYLYNWETKELCEKINKDAYETYWILNAEFKRRIEKLEYEVKNYLISQKQYNALITSTYNEFTQTDRRIAIKFNTFKELEETQEMIRLIKESIVKRNNVSYFPIRDKK